jgi:hypothetical protein
VLYLSYNTSEYKLKEILNKLLIYQEKINPTAVRGGLNVNRGMTQWATLSHSNIWVCCTVLTDCASPSKGHVHERAPSGNTDWKTVAAAWAYSTPAT